MIRRPTKLSSADKKIILITRGFDYFTKIVKLSRTIHFFNLSSKSMLSTVRVVEPACECVLFF